MSRPLTIIEHPDFSQYSEVIDVRTPAEFAEDHIPGAINLCVLDNQQRIEVGTLYKQVSAFDAKKVGAAMMSRNIADWLDQHFSSKDKDYRPLVYCWRGGQRSEGMATILSRINWDTHLLKGGYKNYRNQVIETLQTQSAGLNLRVVSGLTGSGKTVLLERLKTMGEQVIDLEGLANHRGSLLGHHPDTPQPSQKYFESLLAKKISELDSSRVTWIEAESNKIGNLHCPTDLWQNMKQSAAVHLQVELTDRVQFLLGDYDYFVQSPELVAPKLQFLRKTRGTAVVNRWEELLSQGHTAEFVEDILLNHYDVGYSKSIAKNRKETRDLLHMNPLKADSVSAVADQMIKAC